MTWQRILTLVIAVALGAGAWRAGGWAGLALAGTALVLWFLLYYTRVLQVMKRAADRPIGYVDSAVMLNAKLKPRSALLHVMALTRSMGERLSPEGAEPEVYRWTDPGGSQVTAEFQRGQLNGWRLDRPTPPADAGAELSLSKKATDSAPGAYPVATPIDADNRQA
ncbi:glycerate kinase [Ottowia flava]|uniref:Glycerate kinase n=1 Tax=Ottowia flava TaxID=2675430 RepID=A0ABW4KXS8_9BURK|nr:glycerate kinase [Ottowia sp. GY511]